jgi:mono/diheme cytochrome c family protein
MDFRVCGRPGWAFKAGISSLMFGATLLVLASSAWSFPWDIDMYRGAAVQPLSRAPRVMPTGTLPVNRGEPPMSTEMMTVKLKNPLTATSENLAHGKELFLTNCAPCHGESGTGNGTVAHLLKDHPKNLVTGQSKDLPDGYIYGVIRNGVLLMPSYGDAMSSNERWQVVLYVRSLQQGAAAQGTAQK